MQKQGHFCKHINAPVPDLKGAPMRMILRLFDPDTAQSETVGECAARTGDTLARAVWLSGLVPPSPLCSGLGRCGRCRVRVSGAQAALLPPLPEDIRLLGEDAAAEGWRLACRHTVPDAPQLTLDVPRTPRRRFREIRRVTDAARELALAVDLGTTSVWWRALDPDGATAASGHFLNPQAGAGADVMSRLAVAREPAGRARLSARIRESLRDLVRELAADGVGKTSRLCVAGNTAMTDIFLDRDVSGLCAAPYRRSHEGDGWETVPDLPPVYIPPLPAPFVGGDISAGVAALASHMPRPFVLADMGTNGELALLDGQDRLFLTSVPLGPALEGIGPECGHMAGPDSITEFSLSPLGLVGRTADGHTVSDGTGVPGRRATPSAAPSSVPPTGISATGYLSLLATLLQIGVLDEDGRFSSRTGVMPVARTLSASITAHPSGIRLPLPAGLWLSSADVEELLKVKAAFSLALATLLEGAGLKASDLARLCLGGALGEHVRPEHLERLGFLPHGLGARVRAVGNSSLDGAGLLAVDEQARSALRRLCDGASLISLTDAPGFHEAYVRHMRLAWC